MVIGIFCLCVKVFLTFTFRQQVVIRTVCAAGCRDEPLFLSEGSEIRDSERKGKGASGLTVVRTQCFDDSAGFFLDRLKQIQTSFIHCIAAGRSPRRQGMTLCCFRIHRPQTVPVSVLFHVALCFDKVQSCFIRTDLQIR